MQITPAPNVLLAGAAKSVDDGVPSRLSPRSPAALAEPRVVPFDAAGDTRKFLYPPPAVVNACSSRMASWLLALAFLGVGGLMYLAFRPMHLVMFDWAEALGLEPSVNALRALALPARDALPDWVVGSLPGGLWAASLALISRDLWRDSPHADWVAFAVAVPMGVGSEGLQACGLLRGHYDPVDVVAYVLGAAFPLLLAWIRRAAQTLGRAQGRENQ